MSGDGGFDTSVLTAAIARKRQAETPGRRTFARVRRRSVPRGDGGRVILTWAQANERMRAIERWERKQSKRERGRNRAVGHIGIELYRYLCRRAVDRRGRLDDLAYGTIAGVLGFSRSAIVAAAARLKRFGWLGWTRQFEETGEAGVRGPQVKQAPNAFWIAAPIEALIKLGIRFGASPPPDDHAHAHAEAATRRREAEFAESSLGAAVAKLGAAIDQRETS